MAGESVQLRGVHKRFHKLEVLRGIDIDIASGQAMAILGPSGSGKSTLVRCINHLEPIQDGEILVGETKITRNGLDNGGRRLGNREIAKYRSSNGMVFQ